MLVSMHQPHFFPWLPYMAKILHSDGFIILDNFQFSRSKWVNACRWLSRNGPIRAVVPVGHHLKPINEIRPAGNDWGRKLFRTLSECYGASPRWRDHKGFLTSVFLEQKFNSLAGLNVFILEYCLRDLGFRGRLWKSSELAFRGTKVESLVDLLKKTGAAGFLNARRGIEGYMVSDPCFQFLPPLVTWTWRSPAYGQTKGGRQFFPDLSILDLLMNVAGGDASVLLKSSMILEPIGKPSLP
ncbi:MAG: WbqC family protein [Elusimicrobia bacterium]|nr:WbqC family protein [Elusimicrobiota bacterium]